MLTLGNKRQNVAFSSCLFSYVFFPFADDADYLLYLLSCNNHDQRLRREMYYIQNITSGIRGKKTEINAHSQSGVEMVVAFFDRSSAARTSPVLKKA